MIFPFAFASDSGLNAARKGGEGEQNEDGGGERGLAERLFRGKSPHALIKQTKQKLNKGGRRGRAQEKFHPQIEDPDHCWGTGAPPPPRGSPSLAAPAPGNQQGGGRPGSPTLSLFSPPLSGSLSDLAAGSGNLPAKLHLLKGPVPAVSKSASSAKVYQGKES